MATPARQQFLDLKAQHPDALLLFRMGDFYETFDEDAETAARVLGIALTSRPMGKDEGRVPLAGIPYHQLDRYLDGLDLDTGWLVVFDRRSGQPRIAQRTAAEPATSPRGRRITVIRA